MNQTRATNYIGYGSLEAWAAAVDHQRPVYASAASDDINGDRGTHTKYLRIWCAQPDTAGDVHYFRMTVGSITYIFDEPLDRHADQAQARLLQAWGLIRDWLAALGLDVREALVATPPAPQLRYLDGWPDFIRYDKALDRFVNKAAQV